MGKKKGGGKKKKKGGAKKKKGEGPSEASKVKAESLETELSVGVLRYRIRELEAKYEAAVRSRDQLRKMCMEDRKTYKDMEFFLVRNIFLSFSRVPLERVFESSISISIHTHTHLQNKKLDDHYNEIDRLEKRHLNIENDKELSEKMWKERLERETDLLKNELSETNRKLDVSQQELLKLHNFAERKESMEKEIEEMRRLLEESANDTAKQLVELDKRRVREKQDLEKQFEQKLEEAKSEAMQRSHSMLSDTTRKAIEENTRMSGELQYQSKAMEKLMSTNKDLVEENTRLYGEVDLQKKIQLEFAKKTQMYQNLVNKLNEKIQVEENRENVEIAKLRLRDKELTTQLVETDMERESLENKNAHLQRALMESKKEQQFVINKLRALKEKQSTREALTCDTVALLLASMDDVKRAEVEIFESSTGSNQKKKNKKQLRDYNSLPSSARSKLLEILLSKIQSEKVSLLREAMELSSIASETCSSPTSSKTTLPTLKSPKNRPEESSSLTPQIIQAPLRNWGKRSKELPHTLHRPNTFLRKGEGKCT